VEERRFTEGAGRDRRLSFFVEMQEKVKRKVMTSLPRSKIGSPIGAPGQGGKFDLAELFSG
jgi:hypothetical protein